MMRKIITVVILFTGIFLSIWTMALERTSLAICGDGGGWPPYHFEKERKVIGYDIDVLEAIFLPLGLTITVDLPPWQRCLRETKLGRYDIALSAAYSEERDKDYILTDYYYTLQPSYVYSSITYPEGLPVRTAQDLDYLRTCGLQGYNYTGFGVDDSKVRKNGRTFEQVVKMLEANRCDVFLARYEILAGFKASEGIDHLANGLKAVSIPGISGDKFHMLISRSILDGLEIKSIFDQQIKQLRVSGELDRMIEKYIE
ncbi:substrate-binding periplasmic protein [Vibrio metschnikovii]|uniref:substrate-binding periplasmic protein n=2 Tax=Vibrio metschnikovii TaxID=28172 RepID=UPI001C30508C|nr:transporter substrate-binding domain-containing protein [Vibrio metschnikovii]